MAFSFPSWPFVDGELTVSVGIQSRLGGVAFDWRESAAVVEVTYEGRAAGLLNLPLTAALVAGGIEQHESV
jgi:hypothetical protein